MRELDDTSSDFISKIIYFGAEKATTNDPGEGTVNSRDSNFT